MKAEELMTPNVQKCSKDASLEQAARLMWESDVGCLVVTNAEDRPVGMITDRDIAMAAYTQGARLQLARSSQSSPLRAAEIPGLAKTLAAVTEPRSFATAAQ